MTATEYFFFSFKCFESLQIPPTFNQIMDVFNQNLVSLSLIIYFQ